MLIGGRSRRMGEPKALVRLAADGPTMLEQVVGGLDGVATDIALVGSADWPVPTSLAALRRVADGGSGAADGVIAALETSRFDSCLVVGCDMPFLDPTLLRELVTISQRGGTGVIAVDDTGLHPLHAVWRQADLPRIRAMVDDGERSLATIATALGMAHLDLASYGDSARWSVFNANTPADLAIARKHVHS